MPPKTNSTSSLGTQTDLTDCVDYCESGIQCDLNYVEVGNCVSNAASCTTHTTLHSSHMSTLSPTPQLSLTCHSSHNTTPLHHPPLSLCDSSHQIIPTPTSTLDTSDQASPHTALHTQSRASSHITAPHHSQSESQSALHSSQQTVSSQYTETTDSQQTTGTDINDRTYDPDLDPDVSSDENKTRDLT